MICSVCGKEVEYAFRTWQDPKTKIWNCEHDKASIGSSPLEAQRKANRDITIDAQRRAGEAVRESEAIDPTRDIRVQNPDPRFGGNVKVRQSTLDKLTEKAEQYIESSPLPEE